MITMVKRSRSINQINWFFFLLLTIVIRSYVIFFVYNDYTCLLSLNHTKPKVKSWIQCVCAIVEPNHFLFFLFLNIFKKMSPEWMRFFLALISIWNILIMIIIIGKKSNQINVQYHEANPQRSCFCRKNIYCLFSIYRLFFKWEDFDLRFMDENRVD